MLIKKNILSFFKNSILPRLVFIPYLISYLILTIINILSLADFRKKPPENTILCLEAGLKGWDLIEYRELLASAEEYLGVKNVNKVSIDRSKPYVPQVLSALKTLQPSHYLYDSRTGSDNWFEGLLQSFQIAIAFQWHGVVPICVLTDYSVRAWRAQTAVISARRGLVVSVISPRIIQTIYPHNRIIGPQIMAFSRNTLNKLISIDQSSQRNYSEPNLVFTGSLYEPRTTLLTNISHGLSDHGINLEIKGRTMDTQRFSDDEYWINMANSTMVLTTANVMQCPNIDWPWFLHLVYRYLEVPAIGSVLVAQEIPGLRRYFIPDVHYISYLSAEEAVNKIVYYWDKPKELERIAIAGKIKARSIIDSGIYWVCIDTALKGDSLT